MTDRRGPASAEYPARNAGDDAGELYDRAPCGLLVLAGDGTIVRVNAALLDRTGYAVDDVIGRPFSELLEPGARIFYETRFLPVLHLQGEIREVALAFRLANGGALPTLVNATARTGSDPARVDVAVFDAAQRQDFERLLVVARREAEASERRTRILQTATSSFGQQDSEEGLARSLADTVRGALDASGAVVVLDDGVSQVVGTVPRLDDALPSGADDAAVLPGDPIAVVSIGDDRIEPGLSAALREARLEAFARVPLIHDGVALGRVVCYFSRSPELDEHKHDLLLTLAQQAAQTLARIRLQNQLAAIALHDPLTGLANRVLLRTHITASVSAARRSGQPLAFIFVDLDDFKTINDERDHTAGDAVLTLIAARLTATVRGHDLVCRYGGDEFVVVCQDTDEHSAAEIAERIRTEIRRPLELEEGERTVTASIGVTVHAVAPDHVLDGHELLRASDEAMYRSKVHGKDRVTVIRL